ncbi:uncharacterized protein LOC121827841 [Peromyscus maniculatus bairdii]|uniref:uncharacterized protein LOC121827841 n=1 Tax=Peromyscus maniculatus bairdii TaxID=230844 RepID=UPI003FD35030
MATKRTFRRGCPNRESCCQKGVQDLRKAITKIQPGKGRSALFTGSRGESQGKKKKQFSLEDQTGFTTNVCSARPRPSLLGRARLLPGPQARSPRSLKRRSGQQPPLPRCGQPKPTAGEVHAGSSSKREMGGLGRPPPPRPTPPTPRQPRGPTRRRTQPSEPASPAALHADPRGPPAPSSAARAHPQGSRRHLVPPARRHFPPPPARRCASAPARPGRPPAPARAGPGGRGSSVRGPPRRLGEGRAPTPPAAPGRRQPRPAKGPAGPHWAERLRRRPGPEGSIALTSCFGSGHFGRTRMEAPKNTRMEEAATGESGCSWVCISVCGFVAGCACECKCPWRPESTGPPESNLGPLKEQYTLDCFKTGFPSRNPDLSLSNTSLKMGNILSIPSEHKL